MEQEARQCNNEIPNLPERRGENLMNTIMTIGEVIKQPIRKNNRISVHRTPGADSKNQRPKNIIVKLTTRLPCDNFISAYPLNKN